MSVTRGGAGGPAGPALVPVRPGAAPGGARAAVLVLHGGRADARTTCGPRTG
ncbi:hypothetical protein ACGFXC_27090 [Streptomyces sp. NPDC048507]|uniref:hypothetical protein n=1 Tax=Streptomyces sp. NPDC048507 TaxID=3365560 RepID=UPI0037118EAA